MRDRFNLTPSQYRRVAYFALAALSVIVLTGAAVRLTDSGLGCPDWPKCYGKALPPLSTHAVIEYSNRAISGLVGVIAVVAFVLAFFRRPLRRELVWLSLTLPLGVLAQAVLGGFTVREHLAPGFVMGHFALSMIILIGAVALAWRAAYEPGARPRSTDRLGVWAVRALLPLGALTIFAGTAATAAGPALRRRVGPAGPPVDVQGHRHADVGRAPARHDRGAVGRRGDRGLAAGRRRGPTA